MQSRRLDYLRESRFSTTSWKKIIHTQRIRNFTIPLLFQVIVITTLSRCLILIFHKSWHKINFSTENKRTVR
uniref:Uncharacterized protein n=1 Tax=Onchocerca volvulus TaxID=6282 RepID=A0A8R1XXX3_ONCVO